MKKHWHIWVGVAILLFAVLLVLGAVFLPRLAAKSDMKKLLLLAAAPDARYVMLVDPSFRHEGVLAGEGREIALTGALLEQTQSSLASFAENFSYHKKQSVAAGAFGLHLLVRGAEGEVVCIYLTEEAFYAELKGSAYYFTADDAKGYAAFYQALQAAFS